jgi:hypothetical protein
LTGSTILWREIDNNLGEPNMAKKKAVRSDKRPAKLKVERMGDEKVRLSVEFYIEGFYIEELVKKLTDIKVAGGCDVGCTKKGEE